MGKSSKNKNLHNSKMKPIKNAHLKGLLIGIVGGFLIQFLPNPVACFVNDASVQPSINEISQNIGLPYAVPILSRDGYTVAYDGRTKTALWVYEELKSASLLGDIDRKQFEFEQDPDIPKCIQADISDYRGSGFDRGHLVPAGDQKSSASAMRATFYLSNISPQVPQFNRGYWNKVERYIRELTKDYDTVKVVTGPLYLAHDEEDGKRYVTYEVIGKNDVAVPTHFFKVITVGEGSTFKQWAYILPNESIDKDISLDSFRTQGVFTKKI